MNPEIEGLLAKLEDRNFEGPLQHLRAWSEIDAIMKQAAAALRALVGEKEESSPSRDHAPDTCAVRVEANPEGWQTAPADDLEATIAEFKRALPGWWFSVCECQVSCDASCAPTTESPDIERVQYRNKFDAGFHIELSQPASLAEALRDVMEQALEAKAATLVPCNNCGGTGEEVFGDHKQLVNGPCWACEGTGSAAPEISDLDDDAPMRHTRLAREAPSSPPDLGEAVAALERLGTSWRHRLVSGGPGPLYTAGWNAAVNHLGDIARDTLARLKGGGR